MSLCAIKIQSPTGCSGTCPTPAEDTRWPAFRRYCAPELGVDLHNGMESDVNNGISGYFAFPTTLHRELSQCLVLLVVKRLRQEACPSGKGGNLYSRFQAPLLAVSWKTCVVKSWFT